MISTLLFIGFFTLTAIWTAIIIMHFAVGEPTGRHSRFNPGAIPAKGVLASHGYTPKRYASFQAYPVKAA